jgi:hypothetical protein
MLQNGKELLLSIWNSIRQKKKSIWNSMIAYIVEEASSSFASNFVF